jgi:hypothetical protein
MLYMLGYNHEVFNFADKTWSVWPGMALGSGTSPCMVQWKDAFILFGGDWAQDVTQIFNATTQVHTTYLTGFKKLCKRCLTLLVSIRSGLC